jgi:hypothetical protein
MGQTPVKAVVTRLARVGVQRHRVKARAVLGEIAGREIAQTRDGWAGAATLVVAL